MKTRIFPFHKKITKPRRRNSRKGAVCKKNALLEKKNSKKKKILGKNPNYSVTSASVSDSSSSSDSEPALPINQSLDNGLNFLSMTFHLHSSIKKIQGNNIFTQPIDEPNKCVISQI